MLEQICAITTLCCVTFFFQARLLSVKIYIWWIFNWTCFHYSLSYWKIEIFNKFINESLIWRFMLLTGRLVTFPHNFKFCIYSNASRWPLYNSTAQFSNCGGFNEMQIDEHYKIVQLKINTITNVAKVVDTWLCGLGFDFLYVCMEKYLLEEINQLN